uniref:Ribosomal RNA-processing protein 43 n=1 Tax=Caenorhabditis japonica TaxID=281687 RepID=A0A8R1J0F7_CAEJA
MSSEMLRGIDPRGYYATFFNQGVYPDGRGVLDEPKLVFKQGECGGVGSSVVSTQGVTVSCSIDASVSLASDAELVDVKIEPSQQLSEKDADDYNALLLSLFTNQLLIKRENLKCRDADGEKLPLDWQLHVTVKVLSLEGNLLDSAV